MNEDNEIREVYFKSAEVALPTMIDEYTKERERGGILDNKAVGLITILLALVTVYMPIIPFNKVKDLYESGTKNQLIALGIISLIFVLALIITGIAFIKLTSIVKLKTYTRVDIEELTTEDNFILEQDVYEKALCIHYKKIIMDNSGINDIKSNKLNSCFMLTIISFIFLLLSCVGMMIL